MAIAKALATGMPLPLSTATPMGAPAGAAATACFAWERPPAAAGAAGLAAMSLPRPGSAGLMLGGVAGVPAASQEVENFLLTGQVDGEAAMRLRALPPHLQRVVMERGPIAGTRNPSSVLISRIRDAEMGRCLGVSGLGGPSLGLPSVSNPSIERLISQHSLDAKAAAMLRGLTPDQQRVALEIPLHEARNPSAFIMTQLSQPRLTSLGECSRLPHQPRDPTSVMISHLRF